MGNNSRVMNFNFQVAAIGLGNGNELNISSGFVAMNIYINGTATSSTCFFEGKDEDNNWYPIKCANLSTLTMASTTTGKGEIWQTDLTGWNSFRVRISAIAGGNLTVKGVVTN